MALEAAALALGKAVGQRTGRVWLASRAAESERGKDLVELIQVSFTDRISGRRVERQFEEIADKVAERTLSLCAHEYQGLTDNDKASVLAEVTETLQAADLSDETLFAADADAVKLARRLRASLPARGTLSQLGEAGARVYEVVLADCCDMMIRVVQQLPQFTPRTAAEILARLTDIDAHVGAVLARLPVRTFEAPEGTAGDEEFRRRYLELVSQSLDILELFGVRIERYRPRTSLSVAYISLTVSNDDGSGEAGLRRRGGMIEAEGRLADWRIGGHEPEQATVRVETALGRARLMLIRGEAGSGKSTLLRWLAISAARGKFTGALEELSGCTPFLVKLRSYADRELPRPEDLLDRVGDLISGLMPTGWAHRQLLDGRALLLVDGVDELKTSQRKAVRVWLEGMIRAYPNVRVVVTSRPAAADSRWLAAEGFAAVFLERMSPADVKSLIHHWHEAARDAGDLPCGPERLPAFEKALLARLEAGPHLRTLASSSLLAAMLCALNLDRDTQLPRDRMGLYNAALELLLERRDSERQIPSHQEVTLERSQKVQILQDLADKLSNSGRSELPKSATLIRIGNKLEAMPRCPDSAADVLNHLLQRSGVLREPVTGRIDFVHRTVQEYLTAKQIADDGDVEPLVAGAHQDQWREIVIMTAGHANGPVRQDLMAGLLSRIRTEPSHARQLKLLVAGCLETLQSIPTTLRTEIETCLRELVPPRNLQAARSLSAVGEPVLEQLPDTLDGLTTAQACATVRTSWLINGPAALTKLAAYGSDHRGAVQDELLTGWGYFDPEIYAREVIADTPWSNRYLDITNRQLLPYLGYLTHLRYFNTHCYTEEFSFLDRLQQPLRSIIINEHGNSNIGPLVSCV